MLQVLSRRFFFRPKVAALALAVSSRLPPRTRGTQIFSTNEIRSAPSPVVGSVGGASAGAAGAAGAAVASGAGVVAPVVGAAGAVGGATGAVVAAAGGAGGIGAGGAAGAGVWAWAADTRAAVAIRLTRAVRIRVSLTFQRAIKRDEGAGSKTSRPPIYNYNIKLPQSRATRAR